jgi:hypothetical protein
MTWPYITALSLLHDYHLLVSLLCSLSIFCIQSRYSAGEFDGRAIINQRKKRLKATLVRQLKENAIYLKWSVLEAGKGAHISPSVKVFLNAVEALANEQDDLA